MPDHTLLQILATLNKNGKNMLNRKYATVLIELILTGILLSSCSSPGAPTTTKGAPATTDDEFDAQLGNIREAEMQEQAYDHQEEIGKLEADVLLSQK